MDECIVIIIIGIIIDVRQSPKDHIQHSIYFIFTLVYNGVNNSESPIQCYAVFQISG